MMMQSPNFESSAYERLKEGDPKAFGDVHSGMHRPLLSFLYAMLKDSHVAEDLLQETFRDLWAQRGALNIQLSLQSYLFRMARNKALKYLERTKKLEHLEGHEPEGREDAADRFLSDSQRDLARALDALPLEQREIIELKVHENMSMESIATLLDIPLGTAKARYRYGIEKLKLRMNRGQHES